MFWNYLKSALRNLRKNKLFAVINVAGLALGLTIYVFGGLLVQYEQTHDQFFKNAHRTYTLGSYAAEGLDVGVLAHAAQCRRARPRTGGCSGSSRSPSQPR